MSKEKYATISVRLSVEEKAKLVEFCEKYDVSMSQVIRKALKKIINKT